MLGEVSKLQDIDAVDFRRSRTLVKARRAVIERGCRWIAPGVFKLCCARTPRSTKTCDISVPAVALRAIGGDILQTGCGSAYLGINNIAAVIYANAKGLGGNHSNANGPFLPPDSC